LVNKYFLLNLKNKSPIISYIKSVIQMKKITLLFCWILSIKTLAQSIFPLKISENRRYFITQQGKPFLYHADTGWQLGTKLTTEEALEYMQFRKSQGFNALQVQIAMEPQQVNRYGQKAFHGDVDFARPNESYHNHVSKLISMADSLGLLVVLTQPWLGCCKEAFGNSPDKPIQKNGPVKNRQYGNYLGKKFAHHKNLFWIMGGDNDPKGDRESLVAMIEGLYETAPKFQLMTYHASPPHSTTDLFQYAPWVGFSFIYTYWREKPNEWVAAILQPHVYEAAIREWSKSDIFPFVLGESQYEGSGVVENDMGTAHIIRRQAYWTLLCGGAGHAYGSDIWYFPANWRNIMKYEGAYQMGYVIRFFEQIAWWELVPDIKHEVLIGGYGDWSKSNYVTASVSEDKTTLVAYIPEIQSVLVDFNRLNGEKFKCRWYNPRNGKYEKEWSVEKKTVQKLNPSNGSDWVLLVQAEK
jgi:hypothetical protein